MFLYPQVTNPFQQLEPTAFWKTGVALESPFLINSLYKKKFEIEQSALIATAGSCFGQHIGNFLKKNGYKVLDLEPPIPNLPPSSYHNFGYGLYSARYGNIYTTNQLLQLAQEACGMFSPPSDYAWAKGRYYVDGFRPAIEPQGFDTLTEVHEARERHIQAVSSMFKQLDVFIFTLGLVEMWLDQESGAIYPTAPGTIAGDFSDDRYRLKTANFEEVIGCFNQFQDVLMKIRDNRPFKIILTVSPVPITATATGRHVLHANTYAKAILRAVAGQLSNNQSHIDYFPSYEIATNPCLRSLAFNGNLRTVRTEFVDFIMTHFFNEHKPLVPSFETKLTNEVSMNTVPPSTIQNDNDMLVQCEESLLEAFARSK